MLVRVEQILSASPSNSMSKACGWPTTCQTRIRAQHRGHNRSLTNLSIDQYDGYMRLQQPDDRCNWMNDE